METDSKAPKEDAKPTRDLWKVIVPITISILSLAFAVASFCITMVTQTQFHNDESYRVQADPSLIVVPDPEKSIKIGPASGGAARGIEGLQLEVSSVIGGIHKIHVIPFVADPTKLAVQAVEPLEITAKNTQAIGAGNLLTSVPLPKIPLTGVLTENEAPVANYNCFAVRVEDYTGHSALFGVFVSVPVGNTNWDKSFVTVMDDAYLAQVVLPLPPEVTNQEPSRVFQLEFGKAYLKLRQTLMDNDIVSH